ncbi:MAG: lipoprotein-releasing system transmembrane subunit LolC, partial [Thalassospira sp.]|nr:lipoprotein-releasing system transmembrane subunit LolC [Thalassospira sp.]
MFSPFERMVAFRYLRPRRQEGFVSVIAIFSLLGIMLGVATLIIVMSVMNGFRAELLGRILGLNGHISVYAQSNDGIANYDAIEKEIAETGNVKLSVPVVEGQVMASKNGRA